MNQNVTSAGIRRVDYGIDEWCKVIVLINSGSVLFLVHTDGEQSDGIGFLTGQSPCKAVRFVLMLLNHPQHFSPGFFRNIGIVVDHAGYRTSGNPGQLSNIFAAHVSPLFINARL
ncbi:hypothetical protein D3C75_544140 [compost metagenome]